MGLRCPLEAKRNTALSRGFPFGRAIGGHFFTMDTLLISILNHTPVSVPSPRSARPDRAGRR